MSAALLEAAERLAGLLEQENRLLGTLDLAGAAALNPLKQEAVQRFAAARAEGAAALPQGAPAGALARASQRLGTLAEANRTLLERAIRAQARLIELLAEAARPKGPGYTPPPAGLRPTAFAINARA